MRPTSLIGTALVGVVFALSACGGSSTGGDPQSLVGTSYAVTAITIDGGNQEVFDPVEISFAADGISVASPCNGMSGTVTYSETTLTVGALAATKMACEPPLMEQDQVIADALGSNPTWQVTGSQLTLTGGGTVITADSTQP